MQWSGEDGDLVCVLVPAGEFKSGEFHTKKPKPGVTMVIGRRAKDGPDLHRVEFTGEQWTRAAAQKWIDGMSVKI